MNPDFAGAYCFRAMVQLRTRDWDNAKEDLNISKAMGVDIVATFHGIYRSIENYERMVSAKLPEDIAAMLTQS